MQVSPHFILQRVPWCWRSCDACFTDGEAEATAVPLGFKYAWSSCRAPLAAFLGSPSPARVRQSSGAAGPGGALGVGRGGALLPSVTALLTLVHLAGGEAPIRARLWAKMQAQELTTRLLRGGSERGVQSAEGIVSDSGSREKQA